MSNMEDVQKSEGSDERSHVVYIGIDFGTVFSAVSWIRFDMVEHVPNVTLAHLHTESMKDMV